MRGLTRLFRASSFLFAAAFAAIFAVGTAVWAVDELGIFELEGDAKGAAPAMMIPDMDKGKVLSRAAEIHALVLDINKSFVQKYDEPL